MATRSNKKHPIRRSKSKRFFRKDKKRDFRAEYARRILLGRAKGKSIAESRGHARVGEGSRAGPVPVDRNSPLERALKLLKGGATQKQAAKEVGISAERLRKYQKENTTSRREGRRWLITDTRPVPVVMVTRGSMRDVVVSHDVASEIARHWIAVNKFLDTNDATHLQPYVGLGVRDTDKRSHPFETRPNVLRRLDSANELSFTDIYRQTVQ